MVLLESVRIIDVIIDLLKAPIFIFFQFMEISWNWLFKILSLIKSIVSSVSVRIIDASANILKASS